MSTVYELACQRARANSRAFSKASEIESSLIGSGSNPSVAAIASILEGGIKSKQGKLYDEFKHWVYVAIGAIAARVSGQAYGAGKITGGKKKSAEHSPAGSKTHWLERVPKEHRKKACARWEKTQKRLPTCIKEMTQGGQQVEPFFDHDILDFLAKPNSVQSKSEFLFCIIANLLITGEAYVVASNSDDENGFGKEAWAFPTTWITPKHEGELFSSYELKTRDNSEPIPLPKEAVKRLYIPDPSNPMKGCISPLMTQILAVKVDGAIQKSQAATFERIIPNVILSLSETMGPNNTKVSRTLSPVQRRQIVRAVRELWKSGVANGDPAIVGDGLIDSIHKLTNIPAEMDWLDSGQKVKERIFQAFKVNPYVVGHTEGINRASAVESDKAFCNQAVNPLIDQITAELLNGFIVDLFDDSGTLLLWLEEAEPLDVDHQRMQYQIGVANDAIRRNEYREWMGLPIDEDPIVERPKLVAGAVQVLTAMGNGFIGPDSAVALFKYFLGKTEDEAKEIVGDGPPEPPAGPQTGNGTLPAPADENLPQVDRGNQQNLFAQLQIKNGMPTLSRSAVKASRRSTQESRELEVAKDLHPFFPRSFIRQLVDLENSRQDR